MRDEEDLALEMGAKGLSVDPLLLSLPVPPPPGDVVPANLLLARFVKEEELEERVFEI